MNARFDREGDGVVNYDRRVAARLRGAAMDSLQTLFEWEGAGAEELHELL